MKLFLKNQTLRQQNDSLGLDKFKKQELLKSQIRQIKGGTDDIGIIDLVDV